MKKRIMDFKTVLLTAGMVGIVAMTGCSSSDSVNNPGTTTTTISGQVVDGPISGSACNAYQVNSNGTRGTLVGGPVTSNANGNYTITMSYTGPVIVECAGGSYKDWATGTTIALTATDVMSAVVPNASGSVSAQVTPLTHMAALAALKDIASGATAASAISNSNSKIGTHFGVADILNTGIIDPTVASSATGASQAAKDYSLVLAGISQYAKDNSISNPFALVTALAHDASDGILDGKQGATQLTVGSANLSSTAVTSGLSTAIASFISSPKNLSVAAITPALITNIGASTGVFSTTPAIISFTPTSGAAGTTVTITGTNFDATAAGNTVKFNGTQATVSAATATSISTTVPVGATTGTITVTTGRTATSSDSFTVTAPASGGGGGGATSGFTWTENGSATVQTATTASYSAQFNTLIVPNVFEINLSGSTAGTYVLNANNAITYTKTNPFFIPTTGSVIITSNANGKISGSFTGTGPAASGITSVAGTFTDIAVTGTPAGGGTVVAPTIASFSPTSSAVGATVIITGTNFNTQQTLNTVSFNGVQATVGEASATQLWVTVPATATSGNITVTVGGQTATSATSFTVTTSGASGGGSGTAAAFFTKRAVGNSWPIGQTATMNGAPYPAGTGTTSITVTAASGTGVDITTTSTIAATTTGRLELNGAGDLVYISGGVTMTYIPATYSVGTTYVMAPAVTGQGAANATIAAIGVSRTVPAGTFTDCLQISYTKTDPSGTVTTATMYFSASAGSTVEQTFNVSGTGLTLILTQQLQAGYIANP